MKLFYCGFNGFGQCSMKTESGNAIVLSKQDVCSPIPVFHSLHVGRVDVFLGWSRYIISTDKAVTLRGFWNSVSGFEGPICAEGAMKLRQITCTENVAVGINQQGQLVKLSLINCDGSQQSPWQTVLIEGTPESTKYVKVASNEHCVAAIDDAGHIYIPPIKMDDIAAEFIDIACGKEHFMALTKEGAVYTWGAGRGQLGHGDIDSVDYPQEVQILGGVRIVQIACGGWHSCALSDSGDVYIWGWNESGQLGSPCRNLTSRPIEECVSLQSEPRLLDNDALPSDVDVTSVGCGARHTAVTLSDKSGWTWGWNGSGQLGTGDRLSRDVPVRVIRDVDKVICGGWSTLWFASA